VDGSPSHARLFRHRLCEREESLNPDGESVAAHRDLVAGAERVEVSEERDQGAVPGAEVTDIEDE